MLDYETVNYTMVLSRIKAYVLPTPYCFGKLCRLFKVCIIIAINPLAKDFTKKYKKLAPSRIRLFHQLAADASPKAFLW